MAVKMQCHEICDRCGEVNAIAEPDGIRVGHRCLNPVPGPPPVPKRLCWSEAVFVDRHGTRHFNWPQPDPGQDAANPVSRSITHLAGNRIIIGQYAVQRCLLCGEILDEFNARNVASTDGAPPAEYSVGSFYRRAGAMTALVCEAESSHFDSDLDIPGDCCIRNRFAESGTTNGGA